MFQLIYLTFTAPRADPVAFGVLTEQLKVDARQPGRAAGHGVRRGARRRADARTIRGRGR